MKSFGARATGQRLERMRTSAQWVLSPEGPGFVRNPWPIRAGLRDADAARSTLSAFLCGGKRRVPSAPLPALDPRANWRRSAGRGFRATWLGPAQVEHVLPWWRGVETRDAPEPAPLSWPKALPLPLD
jgi:hypothetical protein